MHRLNLRFSACACLAAALAATSLVVPSSSVRATPMGRLAEAVRPHGAPAVRPVADAADDGNFLFLLGLLEGHLRIGRDLIEAGRPKLALPHFGHPIRELYDDLKPDLATRKLAPFDRALIELEAAVVEAPRGEKTGRLLGSVLATLEAARQTVPQAIRDSVPDTLALCANTLEAAAGEYGEAIERGRIEKIVEYHDSRGFVGFVASEVARLESLSLDPEASRLVERFKAVLARAQAIVGALIPADRPSKSVSDYKRIAEDARALLTPRPAAP